MQWRDRFSLVFRHLRSWNIKLISTVALMRCEARTSAWCSVSGLKFPSCKSSNNRALLKCRTVLLLIRLVTCKSPNQPLSVTAAHFTSAHDVQLFMFILSLQIKTFEKTAVFDNEKDVFTGWLTTEFFWSFVVRSWASLDEGAAPGRRNYHI